MSAEQRPKMKLWLRVLLGGSLAMNLAVAGLAAGAALRHARGGDAMRPPPPVGAMLYRELDRETRRQLRREAEGGHGSYHGKRRADGEAVIALLKASPFEPERLARVLADQAAERHGFQISVQKAWLGKVAAMSGADRAEYALRLEEMMRRHPGPPKAPRP